MRKKSGKKKKLASNKNMMPYGLSLFFLGVLLTMTVFLICFQYKPFSQNFVPSNDATISLNDEEGEQEQNNFPVKVMEKPVKFEFYASLPTMKITPSSTEKSNTVSSPTPRQHGIGNAKELEKDVLRHIKHK